MSTNPDWADEVAEKIDNADLPSMSRFASMDACISARRIIIADIVRQAFAQNANADTKRLEWLKERAGAAWAVNKDKDGTIRGIGWVAEWYDADIRKAIDEAMKP